MGKDGCPKGKRMNNLGVCISSKGKIKKFPCVRQDNYVIDVEATSIQEAKKIAEEEDVYLNTKGRGYDGSDFTFQDDPEMVPCHTYAIRDSAMGKESIIDALVESLGISPGDIAYLGKDEVHQDEYSRISKVS